MDAPPITEDVLVQPTRARLFALLGETGQPTCTDDLARELNLHPNGVRIHLERLTEAGLVRRSRVAKGRGRPRDYWSIDPDAMPGGEPPTGYAVLGRWLVEAISESRASLEEIEATGYRIGLDLASGSDRGAGVERMHGIYANLGFKPVQSEEEPGQFTFCLNNCPYRDAVRDREPVVCNLHHGLTRGILEQLDPDAELVGFEARDPDRAGCLIEIAKARSDRESDTEPQ